MTETVAQELNVGADSKPVSEQVVRAVADSEGIDPTALETPLYDAVDPEALDRLFEPTRAGDRSGGRVSFTYYGYRILVSIGDEPEILLAAASEPDDSGADFEENRSALPSTAERSDCEEVHYCLDCGWRAAGRDGHSVGERSRMALEHYVETGHTVESSRADPPAVDGTANPFE